MTLRQLESFLAVVELRSFRKAAARVRLSQPALSHQVKELESELGTALFDRLGRTIAVTEAGRVLEGPVRRTFATLQGAREAVGELQGLQRGSLVLGASSTPGIYLLPRLLGRFKTRYPRIEVALRIGNTRETEERVRTSEVDLGIVGGHLVGERETCVEASLPDRLVLIVAPRHAWAARGVVAPHHLAGERLLVREEGSATRRLTERALGQLGVAVRARLELGHTEAIKEGVRAGLGVAFVSELAVRNEPATGQLRVVRVKGVTIQRHFHVIRHEARELTPGGRAFLECLHAHQNRVTSGRRGATMRPS
ncbi:MAG: LysR substrate-binding domain-containing protein [Candidatus Rokuibacteriota bacterium]